MTTFSGTPEQSARRITCGAKHLLTNEPVEEAGDRFRQRLRANISMTGLVLLLARELQRLQKGDVGHWRIHGLDANLRLGRVLARLMHRSDSTREGDFMRVTKASFPPIFPSPMSALTP